MLHIQVVVWAIEDIQRIEQTFQHISAPALNLTLNLFKIKITDGLKVSDLRDLTFGTLKTKLHVLVLCVFWYFIFHLAMCLTHQ